MALTTQQRDRLQRTEFWENAVANMSTFEIPEGYEIPVERTKPLGTAHAVLCCKEKVHEPFMIINADDFYGRDAFMKGAEFLKGLEDEIPHRYGMVGYLVKNTITENGRVKSKTVREQYANTLFDNIVQDKHLDYNLEKFKEYVKSIDANAYSTTTDTTDTTKPTCANCLEPNTNYVPPVQSTPPQPENPEQQEN